MLQLAPGVVVVTFVYLCVWEIEQLILFLRNSTKYETTFVDLSLDRQRPPVQMR